MGDKIWLRKNRNLISFIWPDILAVKQGRNFTCKFSVRGILILMSLWIKINQNYQEKVLSIISITDLKDFRLESIMELKKDNSEL